MKMRSVSSAPEDLSPDMDHNATLTTPGHAIGITDKTLDRTTIAHMNSFKESYHNITFLQSTVTDSDVYGPDNESAVIDLSETRDLDWDETFTFSSSASRKSEKEDTFLKISSSFTSETEAFSHVSSTWRFHEYHNRSNTTETLQTSSFYPWNVSHSDITWKYPSNITAESYLDQLNRDFARLLLPAVAVLAVLMVVGAVGNVFVLYVYTCRVKRSTVTRFIQALAVFDLLSCCIAIPGEIIDMTNNFTFGSDPLCKVVRTVNLFCTVASGGTLVVVAIDRYKRICCPLQRQIPPKGAVIITCICAVTSLVISLPTAYLYGSRTISTDLPTVQGSDCSISDEFVSTLFPLAYNSLQMLLFLVGAVTLSVLYVLVGNRVCRHIHLQVARRRSLNLSRSRFSPYSHSTYSSHSNTVDNVCPLVSDTVRTVEKESSLETNGKAKMMDAKGDNTFNVCSYCTASRREKCPNNTNLWDEDLKGISTTKEECPHSIDSGNTYHQNGNGVTTGNSEYKKNVCEDHNVVNLKDDYKTLNSVISSGCYKSKELMFTGDDMSDSQTDVASKQKQQTPGSLQELSSQNKGSDLPTTLDLKTEICQDSRSMSIDENLSLPETPQEQMDDPAQSLLETYKVKHKLPDSSSATAERPEQSSGLEGRVATYIEMCDVHTERSNTISFSQNLSNGDFLQGETKSFSLETSTGKHEAPFITSKHGKSKESRDKTLNSSFLRGVKYKKEHDDSLGKARLVTFRYLSERSRVRNQVLNITSEARAVGTTKPANYSEADKTKDAGNKHGTRRTTLMLFLITAIYVLSFLPHLVIMTIKALNDKSLSGHGGSWELVYNLLIRSYFINSAANPVIYSFFSKNFFRECKSLIRCHQESLDK